MTKKLSLTDWENIKKDINNKIPIPQIAKAYNVTRQHIYLRLREEKKNKFWRRIWNWVEDTTGRIT